MSLGPIEMLVVKFPGNRFRGEIIPALKELVEGGIIRIVDILLLHKGEDGRLTVLEVNDLEAEAFGLVGPIVSDLTKLLSNEDAAQLGNTLENNSSAALMLFENTWATRLVDALRNANGELVMSERIPRVVIDELLAAKTAS
ncbi:MAG TPA: DUF6325 family protein [Chloroflexota bacterium]|jgi:uncharacterized membrane protein